MLIRANISRNSHRLLGNDIGRMFVDNGSSTYIITWHCFTQMGFNERDLRKAENPLYGFGGKLVQALGKRDLNVTFGEGPTRWTQLITFDTVDIEYPYNAIFDWSTLNKFSAALH